MAYRILADENVEQTHELPLEAVRNSVPVHRRMGKMHYTDCVWRISGDS